ncbi:MAG: N-formylglutamate amidohydrolase [Gammaproteobacteria bacterium]
MTLPLLLSVPHSGWEVPPEVADLCVLTEAEIVADGDEGAAEVYLPLETEVEKLVTTRIARAIVDQNRAEEDRRKDGVVKTHTCWDVPVYRCPLDDSVVEALLEQHHRPYHRLLSQAAKAPVRAGVDCHTMAVVAPPVAPDAGAHRPDACIGDGHGATCPREWSAILVSCLSREFDDVRLNEPFSGGYIPRAHAKELPWIQLELSRSGAVANDDKSARVLRALTHWCEQLGWI